MSGLSLLDTSRLPVTTTVRDRMLGGVNSPFHPVWLFLLSALCTFKFKFPHYLYKSTALNVRYVCILISPRICYNHLQIDNTQHTCSLIEVSFLFMVRFNFMYLKIVSKCTFISNSIVSVEVNHFSKQFCQLRLPRSRQCRF